MEQDNLLKITIEVYGNKHTIETHADQHIDDVKGLFRTIMTIMAFYPSQCDEVIVSEGNNSHCKEMAELDKKVAKEKKYKVKPNCKLEGE